MPSVEIVVPGTALLVPGVAGGTDVLADERARVLADLRAVLPAVLQAAPGTVEVRVGVSAEEPVPPTDAPATDASPDASPDDPVRGAGRRPVPDLGAVGVAPRWWGWAFHGNDDARDGSAGLAATVALLALGAAGWDGPVVVHERADGAPGARTSASTHDGDAVVVLATPDAS